MKLATHLTLILACALSACSAVEQRSISATPEKREPLLSALHSLAGHWTTQMPDGETGAFDFTVTSNGSVVREIMFPGSEHEMTNMYALDGDSLVMTHYCAGGNQPSMRATAMVDGRLEFEFEDVRDLKAPDEVYMGSMTLEFVDADHVVEHWRAFRGDELDHENTIRLARTR